MDGIRIEHRQRGHRVRLEWGVEGADLLASECAAVVIVDVLSFSTSVDIAIGRGARVLPQVWGDRDTALAAAEAAGAVPAGPRGGRGPSLRPSSLTELAPGTLLALPSPNGATLCARAAAGRAAVFAGCLRNASAVAAAALAAAGGPRAADAGEPGGPDPAGPDLAGPDLGRPGAGGSGAGGSASGGPQAEGHAGSGARDASPEGAIGIVAAGERWPDETMRVAAEDAIGAGAIAAALADLLAIARPAAAHLGPPGPQPGTGPRIPAAARAERSGRGGPALSPEARLAAAQFSDARSAGLRAVLSALSSGQELIADGYAADVALAAALDVSRGAPRLNRGVLSAGD